MAAARPWLASSVPDADELKAGSPLRSPEKIKIPVLLVHGDDDIQVLVDHSKRMARALDGAKKKPTSW